MNLNYKFDIITNDFKLIGYFSNVFYQEIGEFNEYTSITSNYNLKFVDSILNIKKLTNNVLLNINAIIFNNNILNFKYCSNSENAIFECDIEEKKYLINDNITNIYFKLSGTKLLNVKTILKIKLI